MSIEANSTALGATVIDFAAHRAKRVRRAGPSPATPNVMWVPMMMMVLVPVPVGGADLTHAG